MRKTSIVVLCSVIFALFFACEKTDDGSYAAPLTLYEKLAGTWQLTGLLQIDELAKASAITPDEMELKSQFGFTSLSISLNVDTDSLPTTFEVTGGAPALFIESGYWDLDNAFINADGTSNKILLYSDEAKSDVVDELSLVTIPGARTILEFKLTRIADDVPFVSYQYKFKKAN